MTQTDLSSLKGSCKQPPEDFEEACLFDPDTFFVSQQAKVIIFSLFKAINNYIIPLQVHISEHMLPEE